MISKYYLFIWKMRCVIFFLSWWRFWWGESVLKFDRGEFVPNSLLLLDDDDCGSTFEPFFPTKFILLRLVISFDGLWTFFLLGRAFTLYWMSDIFSLLIEVPSQKEENFSGVLYFLNGMNAQQLAIALNSSETKQQALERWSIFYVCAVLISWKASSILLTLLAICLAAFYENNAVSSLPYV